MIQNISVVSNDVYIYGKCVLLSFTVEFVENVFSLYGVSFWL